MSCKSKFHCIQPQSLAEWFQKEYFFNFEEKYKQNVRNRPKWLEVFQKIQSQWVQDITKIGNLSALEIESAVEASWSRLEWSRFAVKIGCLLGIYTKSQASFVTNIFKLRKLKVKLQKSSKFVTYTFKCEYFYGKKIYSLELYTTHLQWAFSQLHSTRPKRSTGRLSRLKIHLRS